MDSLRKIGQFLSDKETGARISFAGALLWCLSLPFAQVQHTRFTSIFLFTILGGFLIGLLRNGFSIFRVSRKQVTECLPFVILALLPLIHVSEGGDSAKELVMRAPFFFVPYLLFYQANFWPVKAKWFLVLALLVSFLVCTGHLFSYGFGEVFASVRSEKETVFFIMNRPYFGFTAGALFFFLTGILLPSGKGRWVEYLMGFLVVGLLFVVLTKMALLSFLAGSLIYFLYRNRKNVPVLVLFGSALLLISLFLGYKILNSEAFHQVVDLGGINFETIPKAYSNSINNRLILWRASLEILSQGNHWMTGFSPEQLQMVLDRQVAVHNGYLTTQHLNPHNQFLYLVLKYGIAGGLAFIFLWYRIFRSALVQKNAYWLGLWSFVFICSFTEVYLDRELGIQLFILFFFLSSPKPGGSPRIPS